jgi:hypothetical protein
VDDATKSVRRSSDLEWKYWRQTGKNLEANRVNTGTNRQRLTKPMTSATSSQNFDTISQAARVSRQLLALLNQQQQWDDGKIDPVDDPSSANDVADDPKNSHSTRRFNVRGNSGRSVIASLDMLSPCPPYRRR